jgi:hypothetical protein
VHRAEERNRERVDAATHRVEERGDETEARKLHDCIRTAQVVVRAEQQDERRGNEQGEDLGFHAAECLCQQVVPEPKQRER